MNVEKVMTDESSHNRFHRNIEASLGTETDGIMYGIVIDFYSVPAIACED
jgi:hypothetical protein